MFTTSWALQVNYFIFTGHVYSLHVLVICEKHNVILSIISVFLSQKRGLPITHADVITNNVQTHKKCQNQTNCLLCKSNFLYAFSSKTSYSQFIVLFNTLLRRIIVFLNLLFLLYSLWNPSSIKFQICLAHFSDI